MRVSDLSLRSKIVSVSLLLIAVVAVVASPPQAAVAEQDFSSSEFETSLSLSSGEQLAGFVCCWQAGTCAYAKVCEPTQEIGPCPCGNDPN